MVVLSPGTRGYNNWRRGGILWRHFNATYPILVGFQMTGRYNYTEQLTHYFTASGNDDADKKRAILLSTCGTAAYKLLKTLVAPANLSTMSFEDLVKKALEHYNPQPSVIMRRFKFNSSVRQQGESVANFVSRLRDLASHCEYGDSAKELIRDRLVCGIRDDRLQRTLLAVPKLTFEKAFELALLHESAEQNAQILRAPVEVHVTSTPAPNATGRDRPTSSSLCYRCGGQHLAKMCRFKEVLCNHCGKKGHIKRVCRSRGRRPGQAHRAGAQGKTSRTHLVDSDEQYPTPAAPTPLSVDYNMYVVGTDRVDPYTALVEINEAPLHMQVDTGAALSLISETTYSKAW